MHKEPPLSKVFYRPIEAAIRWAGLLRYKASILASITFFAAVSSEGLNYSLVLRPRQQNSSNNFHQRPRTAISSPDNRRRIHGYQRPAPATPLDTQVSLRQEWHQHRTLRPRLV